MTRKKGVFFSFGLFWSFSQIYFIQYAHTYVFRILIFLHFSSFFAFRFLRFPILLKFLYKISVLYLWSIKFWKRWKRPLLGERCLVTELLSLYDFHIRLYSHFREFHRFLKEGMILVLRRNILIEGIKIVREQFLNLKLIFNFPIFSVCSINYSNFLFFYAIKIATKLLPIFLQHSYIFDDDFLLLSQ